MAKQTQGAFETHLGELAETKSQSGSGRKYHSFDFQKHYEEKGNYTKKGDRYYDFEEGCWKRKK